MGHNRVGVIRIESLWSGSKAVPRRGIPMPERDNHGIQTVPAVHSCNQEITFGCFESAPMELHDALMWSRLRLEAVRGAFVLRLFRWNTLSNASSVSTYWLPSCSLALATLTLCCAGNPINVKAFLYLSISTQSLLSESSDGRPQRPSSEARKP